MRGSKISIIKGLRLLDVFAQGVHVLIRFFLLAIMVLLGKMFLTSMPMPDGRMLGVALNERGLGGKLLETMECSVGML